MVSGLGDDAALETPRRADEGNGSRRFLAAQRGCQRQPGEDVAAGAARGDEYRGRRHRARVSCPVLDLTVPQRIHVVGAGGAGMSAIADVLARMGHSVSGSDLKPSANLERLRGLGVKVHIGHDPSLVAGVDAVAISTAVPARDPEVRAAREAGTAVLSRAEVLTAIVATRRAVAVAGTHGKTTTSSMLALILVEAGLRPSFIVGGELNEIGTGAAWDVGEWLVVEADESDGTFLQLAAEAAVVTSVEPDHLEHYGGVSGMVEAFDRFLAQTPGVKVASADDELAARLGRAHGAVTYGTAEDADYRIVDLQGAREGTSFTLVRDGVAAGQIRLPVPGHHNARNAAAAAVTALEIGAPFDAAARALSHYGGVARRFQFRGERSGVTFVDGPGHRQGGRLEARGLRVPAPSLQPHPGAGRRLRPRLHRRRPARRHRCLPGRGGPAAGGVGQAHRQRRPRRPSHGPGGVLPSARATARVSSTHLEAR